MLCVGAAADNASVRSVMRALLTSHARIASAPVPLLKCVMGAGARRANGYRRALGAAQTAAVHGDWGGADEASISSNRPRVSLRESVVCVRESVVRVVSG